MNPTSAKVFDPPEGIAETASPQGSGQCPALQQHRAHGRNLV